MKKEKSIFDFEEFEIPIRKWNPFIRNNIKAKKFRKSDIRVISENEFETIEVYSSFSCSSTVAIEEKEKQKKLLMTDKVRYTKTDSFVWERKVLEHQEEETGNVKTCMDVFKELGSYKLIETEAEFEDYLNSNVNCNDWCALKLAKTMLSLNLGQGFINGFANLIGTDLQRYNEMIDLSKECESRDILMYLLVQKYGGKG